MCILCGIQISTLLLHLLQPARTRLSEPHFSACAARPLVALNMGIFEDVTDGVKTAMKAKDAPRVQTLRLIKNALQVIAKEKGLETLANEESVTVLRKLAKQSVTAFVDAGRDELAADERAELVIIDEFLPSLADEATTRKWVEEAIKQSGATEASQMGKVMGFLMKSHKGEMDGTVAKNIAEEIFKVCLVFSVEFLGFSV
ncbi:Yqey-like protein-domain-containing protein [Baffinella frigidus]|nr:Yqey-like protein-domain-containing protein [Cryptophyta sp. CCMP2293]